MGFSMMKNKISRPPAQKNYNLSYGYGDDLREIPEDANSMVEYCQAVTRWIHHEMSKEEDQWDVVSLVTQIGQGAAFLKMLGSLDEAEDIFNCVIEICEKEKEVSVYLDVAYQDMGKLHFDLEDYKKALHYFDRALELRKIKKDQSLIDSTEMAIDVTMKKLL